MDSYSTLFPVGHRSIPSSRIDPALRAWAGTPDPTGAAADNLGGLPTPPPPLASGEGEQQKQAIQVNAPPPIQPPAPPNIKIEFPAPPPIPQIPQMPAPLPRLPSSGGGGGMSSGGGGGMSGPSRPNSYTTNPYGGTGGFTTKIPVIYTNDYGRQSGGGGGGGGYGPNKNASEGPPPGGGLPGYGWPRPGT